MSGIVVKKQDYSRCEHGNNFILFIWKKVYKLTLLVAVEAVAIVSQIFESPNCILMHKDDYFGFWRRIFGFRNLNGHISTFDIVTTLIRR